MPKPTSKFYYQFRFSSRGQSTGSCVRAYDTKPANWQLKDDIDEWCNLHSVCRTTEYYTYSWTRITRPPANRKECLAKYEAACKRHTAAKKNWELWRDIIMHPDFSK